MSHGSGPGSWVEFSSVSQTRILCEFGLPRHQVLLHQVWRPNLQQGRGSLLIFAAVVERPVLEGIRRADGENNTHLKNIICRVFPPPDSPFSSDRTTTSCPPPDDPSVPSDRSCEPVFDQTCTKARPRICDHNIRSA